jgi:predicted HAD superfamily Cof-like phosphohydrolase
MTDRTRFENYFKDPETVDMAEMYTKFNLPVQLKSTLAREVMQERMIFLREEVEELAEAIENKDFLEQIDALIDIAVIVKGSATLMGLRWKYHWDEVHRANMMKQRGNRSKRPGMKYDLIKPPGWIGPDHLAVMDRHGRTG